MSSHPDTWFGISKDGEKLMISHKKLMRWACQNGRSFDVGWGESVVINGDRLARSRQAAVDAGWHDVACAPFHKGGAR